MFGRDVWVLGEKEKDLRLEAPTRVPGYPGTRVGINRNPTRTQFSFLLVGIPKRCFCTHNLEALSFDQTQVSDRPQKRVRDTPTRGSCCRFTSPRSQCTTTTIFNTVV
eukprot:3288450-Rhodomonas_salina.1